MSRDAVDDFDVGCDVKDEPSEGGHLSVDGTGLWRQYISGTVQVADACTCMQALLFFGGYR